jgi:energy-coupling factor transporter ATP-binding protein EcfA2
MLSSLTSKEEKEYWRCSINYSLPNSYFSLSSGYKQKVLTASKIVLSASLYKISDEVITVHLFRLDYLED